MKILHFLIGRCNPDSANGVEKTVSFLTKEFAKQKNEVYLLSLTKKEIYPLEGVKVIGCKPSKVTFLLPNCVKKYIDKIEPDLVHLHSVYTPQNLFLSRWFMKKGIPIVILDRIQHDDDLFRR